MKINVDNSTKYDGSMDISDSSNLVKFILIFTVFWFVPLILIGLACICGSDYIVPMGQMRSVIDTVGELLPFAALWAGIGVVVMCKVHVRVLVIDCMLIFYPGEYPTMWERLTHNKLATFIVVASMTLLGASGISNLW